ncbi:hypothetical protein JTE90_029430 [Oedothorax gibbosus]|uniref:Uncharacterized protein n=1 Tax=Oedothorax gibbosus TaxID=931172 RepID=A0AAV6TEE9_9ARAC|nr:hypothetical protein JTE90_029430 [Oedothorax gibbosus]
MRDGSLEPAMKGVVEALRAVGTMAMGVRNSLRSSGIRQLTNTPNQRDPKQLESPEMDDAPNRRHTTIACKWMTLAPGVGLGPIVTQSDRYRNKTDRTGYRAGLRAELPSWRFSPKLRRSEW